MVHALDPDLSSLRVTNIFGRCCSWAHELLPSQLVRDFVDFKVLIFHFSLSCYCSGTLYPILPWCCPWWTFHFNRLPSKLIQWFQFAKINLIPLNNRQPEAWRFLIDFQREICVRLNPPQNFAFECVLEHWPQLLPHPLLFPTYFPWVFTKNGAQMHISVVFQSYTRHI